MSGREIRKCELRAQGPVTTRRERRGEPPAILGDAMALRFWPGSSDRMLLADALQHFEDAEGGRLFRRLAEILRPRGVLVVTDIPYAGRMWRFFDGVEREDACFDATERESPVLGNWFHATWLTSLARHAGFRSTEVVEESRDPFCSR